MQIKSFRVQVRQCNTVIGSSIVPLKAIYITRYHFRCVTSWLHPLPAIRDPFFRYTAGVVVSAGTCARRPLARTFAFEIATVRFLAWFQVDEAHFLKKESVDKTRFLTTKLIVSQKFRESSMSKHPVVSFTKTG